MKIVQHGHCAVLTNSPRGEKPRMIWNGVRNTAREARRHCGEAWATPPNTWAQGWQRALKEGWRIKTVRIEVTL